MNGDLRDAIAQKSVLLSSESVSSGRRWQSDRHLQQSQYARCSRYAAYAGVDTASFRYSAPKNNH
jgi:hypothetical protein